MLLGLVIAGMLTAAPQDLPRFTMTPEPGDALKAFAVDVTVVRRSPGPNTLTPDQWRARLGDFDWVILAVPHTPETEGMINQTRLAWLRPTATLINIARGALVVEKDLILGSVRTIMVDIFSTTICVGIDRRATTLVH